VMRIRPEDLPAEYRKQVQEQLQATEQEPRTHADTMNKLEARYARRLMLRARRGEIHSYLYASIKLRLADRTWYTPDFAVFTADGIEFHETKGFMRDDANVKLKVAAEMYPQFRFVLVTWDKGGWDMKEIGR